MSSASATRIGATRIGATWAGAALLTAAALLPAGAAQARSGGSDSDPVYISGSRGSFSGEIEWSGSGEGASATLSGTLTANSGCAKLRVDWLNSATRTIDATSRSACGSKFVSASAQSSTLACARVRLYVNGRLTGAPRLVCAGD